MDGGWFGGLGWCWRRRLVMKGCTSWFCTGKGWGEERIG